MNTHQDQREYQRSANMCSVKLYNPMTRRFKPGRTLNTSLHGALVEVNRNANLHPGDEVKLSIDWHEDQVLIEHSKMIVAKVVRTVPTSPHMMNIGLHFENEPFAQTLNAAA